MRTFTIISDPGVDDIVALTLLNKLDPDAHNTLISTFGNAPEEFTEKNAREFIAINNLSWSFKRGSALPLRGEVEYPFPDYFHGPDGIWKIHTDTSIGHVTQLPNFPENDSLLSLGTFTDVLPIIKVKRPTEMTIMGGAFNERGNETEFSEFNMALDVEAAHQFFETCEGICPKVVPLDVTRKALFTEEMVRSLPEENPGVTWMKRILIAWFENYDHEKEKDFNLHDPLSIYLTYFPEHAIWQESGVAVVTEGKERGRTVFKKENPPCSVAVDLKDPKDVAQKIYDVLLGK